MKKSELGLRLGGAGIALFLNARCALPPTTESLETTSTSAAEQTLLAHPSKSNLYTLALPPSWNSAQAFTTEEAFIEQFTSSLGFLQISIGVGLEVTNQERIIYLKALAKAKRRPDPLFEEKIIDGQEALVVTYHDENGYLIKEALFRKDDFNWRIGLKYSPDPQTKAVSETFFNQMLADFRFQ